MKRTSYRFLAFLLLIAFLAFLAYIFLGNPFAVSGRLHTQGPYT